jgi:RHS repeat-associated protein
MDEGARGHELSRPVPGGAHGAHGAHEARGQGAPNERLLAPAAAAHIELPKSGGALKGIGESFKAGGPTGGGGMTISLPVSPCRGAEPHISLDYHSGAEHGPFGIGWSLSIPSIGRRTDKGLPRYQDADESDIFMLAGSEDLVPTLVADAAVPAGWARESATDGAYRVSSYTPRVEGAFCRVERRTHLQTGETHWRTISPNNVTTLFGFTSQARLADPANPLHVFRWMAEAVFDPEGHVTLYDYKSEDLAGVERAEISEATRFARPPANLYVKRVRYGNRAPLTLRNPAPTDLAALDFLFETLFDYGEHTTGTPDETGAWDVRADPYSSFRSGFEIRSYRLCRRVLTFHAIPEMLGAPTRLVRALELTYDEQPTVSYLIAARGVGYAYDANGVQSQAVTPTQRLDYTRVEPLSIAVKSVESGSLSQAPQGIDGATYQFVDLDGEGLPGILTAAAPPSPTLLYKRNLGQGRFASGERLPAQPSLDSLGANVQLMSLNGDGRLDAVRLSGPTPGFFERTRNFDWSPFVPFRQAPRHDYAARGVHFLDVDGDGLTDILIAKDDGFVWHPSLSRDGYGASRRVTAAHDEARGAPLLTTDDQESIFLADMSGDGLSDIVRIRNGEVCYWPNLGYGRFGAKVAMVDAPIFTTPDLFDPRKIRLGDIDGAGPTDIVYLGAHGAQVYFNQAGNSWSAARHIPLPRLDSLASVRVADFLGTGTACLVWASPAPASAGAPLRYVDLLNSTKPHLLRSMSNGLGATTTVTYAPSAEYYLEDRLSGRLWATRLPFVVQTVASVQTVDAIAGTVFTQTYRYAHGFYDGVEREFRGFARVDSRDAVAMSADHGEGASPGALSPVAGQYDLPPTHTVTWFHTGAWNGEADDLRATLAKEFFAGDPAAGRLPRDAQTAGLLPPDLREAWRSLKGRMLRQEVYADDGSGLAATPYEVTEHRYAMRQAQPIAGQRHGVYFPHELEHVTWRYERDAADPRVEHRLSLEVDPLGHILRGAHVAYARRTPAEPEQGVVLATCSRHAFAPPIGALYDFVHGVPTETLEFELALPASTTLFPLETVDAAMTGAKTVAFDQPATSGALRLISHRQQQYWADDLAAPLPVGQAQTRPLLYDEFAFAAPATLIQSVFGARLTMAELTSRAGYASPDGDLWTQSGVITYGPAQFYMPLTFTDPFGNTARVAYDSLNLFVAEEHSSADPVFDNVTTVAYDYRILSPCQLTDPNGNRTAVAFDALGMVTATAVMGPQGSSLGDTLADPTTRIEYDLLAWEQTPPSPAFVHTWTREQHGAANPRWFETVIYSDGSGHEALKKAQGETDPKGQARWIGSGRVVFDNKGNAIKRYEPYYSADSAFDAEADLVSTAYGAILTYDPLSRLIRTDMPDGAFETKSWTAWSEVEADAVDTVLSSAWYAAAAALPASDPLNRAAVLAAQSADTPTTHVLDPLGRKFLTIEDNGAAGKYATRHTHDIQDNVVSVTNPAGVVTLAQTFNAQGDGLAHVTADAGASLSILDVAGRPYKDWDGRGIGKARTYDTLRRLTQLSVTPPGGTPFLAERVVYGEGLAAPNFRGRLYLHFDGAGVVSHDVYDFEGRVTQSSRRLALAYKTNPAWDSLTSTTDPGAILAAAETAALIESAAFTTLTAYDAMARVVDLTTPDGTVVTPTYNSACLMASLSANLRGAASATTIVAKVDYNAQGQRVAIAYGQGVAVDYAYDDRTHLISRIQTTRASDGAALQDLTYAYDPAHNIVQITDAAQQTVYFSGGVVSGTQLFAYDATYRLTSATGREQPGQVAYAVGPDGYPEAGLSALPHPNDLQALLNYTQTYSYDMVGNLTATAHKTSATSWTRTQTYAAGSHRLATVSLPGDPPGGPYGETIAYDADGNFAATSALAGLTFDYAGRLIGADLGGGGAAYYTYDSQGHRVRKVVERGGKVLDRAYAGNYERYRELAGASLPTASPSLERDSVHIFDGKRRFALVETLTLDAGAAISAPASLTRIQFQNQLGSALLETDLAGSIISYEEYYPFGLSSFRAGDGDKRYRYTGKERDEETGFYYHGARYYAPWLSRWISADPTGLADGDNPYVYARNNPIRYHDPTGLLDWPSRRTMGIIAMVAVGVVATAATAGAAGPVVAAAIAGVGLTGTAATVVTGVVVGTVAGAAGGALGEVAHTGVGEGRLPTRSELVSATVTGAALGGVTGGLGSFATTAKGAQALNAVRAAASKAPGAAAVRAVGQSLGRAGAAAARTPVLGQAVRAGAATARGVARAVATVERAAASKVGVPLAKAAFRGQASREAVAAYEAAHGLAKAATSGGTPPATGGPAAKPAITRDAIVAELRSAGSPQALRAANQIERGIVGVKLLPTDPGGAGAMGRYPFNSTEVQIYLDQTKSIGEAAGTAAHEVAHFNQALGGMDRFNYHLGHELEAYRAQGAVDWGHFSNGVSDADLLRALASHSAYAGVPMPPPGWTY